jgi:ubiquinone/menaquinone biosynthesis C-methylase UbiE
LSALKEKDFDKAFIILALQNIEGANKAISEVSRLLRAGGKLYAVLNHPCFRIPEFSEWGWDEKTQYRRISRYLSESKSDILMSPGRDPSVKTVSFHRPLQYFFKAFDKAGFAVARLEEWNSGKTATRPRARAEDGRGGNSAFYGDGVRHTRVVGLISFRAKLTASMKELFRIRF